MNTLDWLVPVIMVLVLGIILVLVTGKSKEGLIGFLPGNEYCEELKITLKEFNENLNAKTGDDKINYYKYYAECFDPEDIDADKEFICDIKLEEDKGYCG